MNGYHLKTIILRHSSKCSREDGTYLRCVIEILNKLYLAFSARRLGSILADRNLLAKPGTTFLLYATKIQCIKEVLYEIHSTMKVKSCAFWTHYSANKCARLFHGWTMQEFDLQL